MAVMARTATNGGWIGEEGSVEQGFEWGNTIDEAGEEGRNFKVKKCRE